MAAVEKRVGGIDVLRGLCIVAVILNHVNLRIRLNQSSFGKWIGVDAINALVWNGHEGVRIFFVISGFLITTWTLRRWGELRRIEVRQFYAMRFARIVPCLVGLLALLAILDRAGVPRFTINTEHTTLARALFAALTFHINWLEAKTGYLPAAWDILWSLSVEEVFYLFFPVLCAWLKKPALLVAVFSAFVVAGPFARTLTKGLWVDYGYSCCMDGIAIGCLAALVCGRFKFGRKTIAAFYWVGAFLTALMTVAPVAGLVTRLRHVGLDETVLELGVALLLIAMQQRFDATAAAGRAAAARTFLGTMVGAPGAVVRWFGRNSYEVYLTHMLVVWPMVGLFAITHQGINMAPVWFVATIALAGALGHVVSRYYSELLNRKLRRGLISRGTRDVAVPAVARELA